MIMILMAVANSTKARVNNGAYDDQESMQGSTNGRRSSDNNFGKEIYMPFLREALTTRPCRCTLVMPDVALNAISSRSSGLVAGLAGGVAGGSRSSKTAPTVRLELPYESQRRQGHYPAVSYSSLDPREHRLHRHSGFN